MLWQSSFYPFVEHFSYTCINETNIMNITLLNISINNFLKKK